LPAEWRSYSPRLSLDFGWMYLLRGALEQVAPFLAQAEAALDVRPPAEQSALRAECLALRANLLQAGGQTTEAIAAAERSLALLPPAADRLTALAALALGGAYRQQADFERAVAALQTAIRASRAAGDPVTEMLAVAHLTLMAVQFGRLRLAAQVATETLARLERASAGVPPIAGAVHGALGLVYIEWNDLSRAREHLQRSIRLGVLSSHNASLIYSQCNLARLLQAEGDLDGAGQALDNAAALLAQGAPGWIRPELIARHAELILAQGDVAAAEAHLRTSNVAPEDPVTHRTDPLHLAWLRLLIARSDARAADLAQRIIRSAEAGSRHGTLLPALLLAARLHTDRPPMAHGFLQRALALAEPEGAIRVFLDEGEAIAALLRQVGCPPWLAQALPSPQSSPLPGDLVEPLSERELEVLRLLAEGLRYAEIAERLVVSLNTVRFHVKEIYSKLGVNRQAQAVVRARELGML
jgi:LuxR family maltose regulon positive regulatory protein